MSIPILYFLLCDAVAGLVGEGLSRLFACTGYEKQEVADVSKTLANTMGLLLQKTNIIRDYLEDYVDGRAFWPQEVRTLRYPTRPFCMNISCILASVRGTVPF